MYKSLFSRLWLLIGFFVLMFFLYQSLQLKMYSFYGHVMGTTYNVKYIGTPFRTFIRSPANYVRNILVDVDNRMSTYKSDSELMQLNAAFVDEPVYVSSDLIRLILESKKISEISGGAYDITSGALVNLWGFGAINSSTPEELTGENGVSEIADIITDSEKVVPSKQAIEDAKLRVNYKAIEVNTRTSEVTRKQPVFIDLSSIAKGFSVDLAALGMKELGFKNFMIEVGGEVYAKGRKLNDEPWQIAIQQPDLMDASDVVHLDGQAIATSGDYLNYFNIGGVRYSHLINANTGYPEQSNLAGVSVIHKETALADAYATMFMILGEKKGMQIALENNINAYFILTSKDGFDVQYTPGFKNYLTKH